ncbi:SAM-dependent methyltransferase [Bosea vaviloviae]|uniref:Cyclopropane-fatty-acyl-phospholipid synthase n=1 Tax=Bosea vaviloviae TaxID=1526658 RepID=A0A1D7TWI2_9HYPH|nr:cyclopropane-fatty-acyl-phospholipid synthase family protein [Bosea vaviloviae]AOO79471.1 cyclopropane-fatty-acyl-phospholipid synthase [Bosea vaviloviae]
MLRILQAVLSRLVVHGTLHVVLPDGRRFSCGDGSGAPVQVRFADRMALWAFLLDPEMKLGELFMDRRLLVEQGTIHGFLALILSGARGQPARVFSSEVDTGSREENASKQKAGAVERSDWIGNWSSLVERALDHGRFLLRHLTTRNTRGRSRENVAHHYDLDDRLYALFLDADWQYSCAYFENPEQSLDDAQLAKKRHIAAKLLVEPEHRVLDIGCGWGGMCLYLTETARAREALGVTLSREQLAVAKERAQRSGAGGRARFALQDYRDVVGVFERIVSVGMFEHIGPRFYPAFFETCRRLLSEDGVMLLHTIGCSDGPNHPNPWLNRYIFPGGYLPALSEILPAAEKAGLIVTDVEVLRLHYAKTLQAWRERFMARREEALALYDERFCLMWEFYLAMSQAAFEHQDVVVFQLQIVRHQEAVPLTRDYIDERKAALRMAEAVADTARKPANLAPAA